MARKDRDMPDGARTPASFSTVDEQTKAQAMRAAQATPAPVEDDSYFTKVLASGKTQAQIDALRGAYDTAEVIRQQSPTKTSTVDRATGKVVTTARPPSETKSTAPK
jgi:hypothetical protein